MKNEKLREAFNKAFENTNSENIRDVALNVLNEATRFSARECRDDGFKYVYASIYDDDQKIASVSVTFYYRHRPDIFSRLNQRFR